MANRGGRIRLISKLRVARMLLFYPSYRNNNHSMAEDVFRILRSITGELSFFAGVLVIGDITSAYCVDRKRELTWEELRGKLGDEFGASSHFEAWSGAAPVF